MKQILFSTKCTLKSFTASVIASLSRIHGTMTLSPSSIQILPSGWASSIIVKAHFLFSS
jgi:hypothetical protein